LELTHNWWQVSVCVSYVFVGLAFLIILARRPVQMNPKSE